MEAIKDGLQKIEKIDIKKSTGFAIQQCLYASNGSQEERCPKNMPTGTEKHHVSHVLTFFSYMAYNAKGGTGVKARLLDRAIHHLAALREFVEDSTVIELVSSLYENARSEREKFPAGGEQPAGLIRAWLNKEQTILKLAGHYQKKAVFDGLLPIPVSVEMKKNTGTAIRDRGDLMKGKSDEEEIA